MVIVSITPEIALERSVNYAGGLGVLKGDMFYAAGDMGLDYLVLTLFYRHGYVKIRRTPQGGFNLEPEEQGREFYAKFTPDAELTVYLNNSKIHVIPWIYRYKTARAVLFDVVCPEWARRLNERVYIENDEEEKFMKYALLAKASAQYLRERVGIDNIAIIDLEESYTSLILYELKEIASRARIIIHTPGPWGHPIFPGHLIKREFQVDAPPMVNMTVESLKVVNEAVVVSKKQKDIISKVFPDYSSKFVPVTNGINLERWMNPKIYNAWKQGVLDEKVLKEVRSKVREELQSLLRHYKPDVNLNGKVVVAWARRLARYKRPYFIARFIQEYHDPDVVYVLAGKPHPRDPDGLSYLETFNALSQKYGNVVYIPDYNIETAKILVSGSDIWLFTPFSGWEACGTSYMKALVNGVPVISSRDGGALEVIEDGVNGWLFGTDIREFIDIYNDPRAKLVDEKDFEEFKLKLREAINMFFNEPDKYWEVSLNAARNTPNIVDVKNVLAKYYGCVQHR